MTPTAPVDARWDAIVVGTGFGGAVTAARLAERGMRVLVLERGPWWGQGGRGRPENERRDFPRGVRGMLRSVRTARRGRARRHVARADGLWELHRFDHLVALTASGVGGGSLVYTNMQVPAEPDYFRAFPAEITAAEIAPYYARVRSMLRPEPVPFAHPLDKERAFERTTRAAGLGPVRRPELAIAFGDDPRVSVTRVNAAGVEQDTCTYRGECILGCPQGAKTTLDLTYVPVALRSGARLRALTEVVALARKRARWSVHIFDHVEGRASEVLCDRLYLCAGTLSTVRLLFEAGEALALPSALGRRFSANGDHGSLLRALAEPVSGRGPSVGALVRIPADGPLRGMMAEMGIPPADALPWPLARYLRGSLALLAMGRDGARGTLTFRDGALHTDLSRDASAGLLDEFDRGAGAIADAYGARRVRLNLPAGRGARTLGTVHPLGGAAIASGPEEGVVDHLGRVFGQPSLFVVDGSILPDAPGVPPSMTIAALAERIAELS